MPKLLAGGRRFKLEVNDIKRHAGYSQRWEAYINDSYINLGDFEKFVRNRFKNIVGGPEFVIPRIAVKIALDDVFKSDPTTTIR